jgi:hypothetical protein
MAIVPVASAAGPSAVATLAPARRDLAPAVFVAGRQRRAA